jgi:hypothetical protein
MGIEVTSATGALWINGVVNTASVTVVDDAGSVAGIRKVSYTVPTGLSEGTTVQCVITATVSGITASSVMRNDEVVSTRSAGDYPTSIAYNSHGDISAVNWYSGKSWTYGYNGSYQLTGITEA